MLYVLLTHPYQHEETNLEIHFSLHLFIKIISNKLFKILILLGANYYYLVSLNFIKKVLIAIDVFHYSNKKNRNN